MDQLTLIQQLAVYILPILLAIILHEVAHGWVASYFGDQTARLSGRLTLNPLKHIDVIGTIIVPVSLLLVGNFIFGWAKPVPVDARNLRHPRHHMAIVAAAGPLANLLMAFGWGGVAKLGIGIEYSSAWLAIPLIYISQAGIMINVFLAILNCIPIPPLDGGNVVANLLPPHLARQFQQIQPYGFLILLILMLTRVLAIITLPLASFLSNTVIMFWSLN